MKKELSSRENFARAGKKNNVSSILTRKKSNAGRKEKYDEPSFIYGGVRLPISWRGTDKIREYKRRMHQVIKDILDED